MSVSHQCHTNVTPVSQWGQQGDVKKAKTTKYNGHCFVLSHAYRPIFNKLQSMTCVFQQYALYLVQIYKLVLFIVIN